MTTIKSPLLTGLSLTWVRFALHGGKPPPLGVVHVDTNEPTGKMGVAADAVVAVKKPRTGVTTTLASKASATRPESPPR
jgi:hypothetical protein